VIDDSSANENLFSIIGVMYAAALISGGSCQFPKGFLMNAS